MSNKDRIGALDGISGVPDDEARLDMIRNMMGLNDPIEANKNEEISDTPSSDATPVEDVVSLDRIESPPLSDSIGFETSHAPAAGARTVEQVDEEGNLETQKDSDKDGILDYLDGSPYGDETSPAAEELLNKLLSTDTDGDGILDFLDRTGSESQIEQMYDKDFERKLEARKEEVMRGFLSLISMFSNFDLTKFSKQASEPGGDALTVMVAAGAAQVSLTHSARLQELPTTFIPQKEDLKQLMKQYKNKSKEAKIKNLRLLDHCVEAMPETNPMKAILQKALKSVKPSSTPKKM
jgi:hypothetical protein